jgi:hypothetical protein
MSKQNDPIGEQAFKADISYENQHFEAKTIHFREDGNGYSLEGIIAAERKRLQLFTPSEFDVTKTYTLVPHSPKKGEAQLVFIQPSSHGYFNFRSDRGKLSFIAEAGMLHGVFESHTDAQPGDHPEVEITGSFKVFRI